jgi:hypothetical protein
MYPKPPRRSYVYCDFFEITHEKHEKTNYRSTMACSPSPLPTNEIVDDDKDAKNDSSLIILDDGRIVWRQSLNEIAQKDDSQNQLNDVLKQMGLEDCSAAVQTAMIQKYNSSVAKLNPKNGHDSPMLEEVLQLMKEWSPKTDLITLHVRWAKKSKHNFHFDSMSTLLTVSNQCGLPPLIFLTKAKTLVVNTRTKRNVLGKFGVKFLFKTVNNERANINRDMISRQFAGLALTLAMLQSTTAGSRGAIGKVGMRQKAGTRTSSAISISTNESGSSRTAVHGFPLIEFHKESSLHHRLWLNIIHRWMSFQLVEHLFKPIVKPWRQQEALEYSFRMHSGAGVDRFSFLNPMVGLCLRFPDATIMQANSNFLMGIWNNPNLFISHGNRMVQQMSHQQTVEEIATTFSELQDGSSKQTFMNCRDCDRTYLMLRGYIFHYWLEKSSNKKEDGLLNCVVEALNANGNVWQSRNKKRKINTLPDEVSPGSNKKAMVGVPPSIPPLSTVRLAQLVKRRKAIRNRESSGYSSLMASRRKGSPPSGVCDDIPVIDK